MILYGSSMTTQSHSRPLGYDVHGYQFSSVDNYTGTKGANSVEHDANLAAIGKHGADRKLAKRLLRCLCGGDQAVDRGVSRSRRVKLAKTGRIQTLPPKTPAKTEEKVTVQQTADGLLKGRDSSIHSDFTEDQSTSAIEKPETKEDSPSEEDGLKMDESFKFTPINKPEAPGQEQAIEWIKLQKFQRMQFAPTTMGTDHYPSKYRGYGRNAY
ncbi:hypothetical protein MJO28_003432 [Puccinia striiformis f. sp. tritici]|nr:hypothetical protein Pst134EA_004655 [Puccinia striiformis f. sp. tritici]KAI9623030.1 hypothetical protein KEM48_009647 [Puccinia striiformis f. sp. tritici PST-130]POV98840.1 hypothetical protein PSTT_14157 [Puccinia striiformis]KAH9461804.1 hypothetical protein Pst134EB_005726 [Puccinia striiformis f. sp. tritici]KAH9461807.1 hypothetical protein Pst134EB_005729 [Puccinia striiformis f. sp. tritici]KAH9470731.1 hypothetical protein Pst134EA_004655 [Puccinia striiformis f. sp. tritici]